MGSDGLGGRDPPVASTEPTGLLNFVWGRSTAGRDDYLARRTPLARIEAPSPSLPRHPQTIQSGGGDAGGGGGGASESTSNASNVPTMNFASNSPTPAASATTSASTTT